LCDSYIYFAKKMLLCCLNKVTGKLLTATLTPFTSHAIIFTATLFYCCSSALSSHWFSPQNLLHLWKGEEFSLLEMPSLLEPIWYIVTAIQVLAWLSGSAFGLDQCSCEHLARLILIWVTICGWVNHLGT